MTNPFNYQSVLAPYMEAVIRIKASRGFNILSEKWTYKEFDEFTLQYGLSDPVITKELIDTWAKSRENDCSRTFYGKCSRLAQLARYMNEHGIRSYIMPLPKCSNDRGFIPYIFTAEQMQAIFEQSDNILRESRRKDDPIIAIPCLIRLLYSTGLRISEAISLRNSDVSIERNFLKVGTGGSTKNGEERLVPICSSLKDNLLRYVRYRSMLPLQGISDKDRPFFIKLNGTALSAANAYHWFRKIYTKCGIAYRGEKFGPRVHDLRHTMATHSLAKMIRDGLDIYAALPLLAACLGHKSLHATEGYVRLTCNEYPELSKQCSLLNNFIYTRKDENK
jgi:integrase